MGITLQDRGSDGDGRCPTASTLGWWWMVARVVQRGVHRRARLRPMASCLFCAVIAGIQPAEVVLDDEVVVAFLDHRRCSRATCWSCPGATSSRWPTWRPRSWARSSQRVQRIAVAVPAALAADGTFVAMNNVVSQSVAHLHVHVVPRRRKDGLRGFFWPRQLRRRRRDGGRYAAPHPRSAHVTIRIGRPSRPRCRRRGRGARRARSARPTTARRSASSRSSAGAPRGRVDHGPKRGQQQRLAAARPVGACASTAAPPAMTRKLHSGWTSTRRSLAPAAATSASTSRILAKRWNAWIGEPRPSPTASCWLAVA